MRFLLRCFAPRQAADDGVRVQPWWAGDLLECTITYAVTSGELDLGSEDSSTVLVVVIVILVAVAVSGLVFWLLKKQKRRPVAVKETDVTYTGASPQQPTQEEP